VKVGVGSHRPPNPHPRSESASATATEAESASASASRIRIGIHGSPVTSCVSFLLLASGCTSALIREADRFAVVETTRDAAVADRKSRDADDYFRLPRTAARVEASLDASLGAVSSSIGFEGLWKAARAAVWLSERHDDPDRRHFFARRGLAIARESVRLSPERVEPHYYLALCLARASEIERTAKYLDELAAAAARAIAKDEKFDRAGPLRALGLLHLRTEGKLLAGFGDLDEALRHLGRAALLFPEDAENQIAYAEALLVDEDIAAARRAVAAALASSPPPDLEEEHRGWLAKARKLREKIEASQ